MPPFLHRAGHVAGPMDPPLRNKNVTWDHWLGHQDSENGSVSVTGRQSTTESGEGSGVGWGGTEHTSPNLASGGRDGDELLR